MAKKYSNVLPWRALKVKRKTMIEVDHFLEVLRALEVIDDTAWQIVLEEMQLLNKLARF